MERMGDILAKNASRRASQRRPPSEPAASPPAASARPPATPSTTPTSASAAARQPEQGPARAQRAPTSNPLGRRYVASRPRHGVRSSVPPAPVRAPTSRPLPPDARPADPASAAPPADTLDSDRILELPRRAPLTHRLAADAPAPAPAANVSPQRNVPGRATQPAKATDAPSLAPDAALVMRLAARRPVAPTSPAMMPLRELAQGYLINRPAGGAGDAKPKPPATAKRAASALRSVEVDPDVCPICGGTGFVRLDVPVGDPSFGQAVPCSCKERQLEERHRSELRRLSSLDPFVDKTFETFDPSVPGVREAYEVARRYADDPQGWLMLMGGYGGGKTHLAAAIAHQRLGAGSPVFFSIVPDLLDHLRAAFAPTAEIRYDDMFDRIREAGLLILDDLGAENGTAWATEKLFQLINYRYNFRIPTVITTNNRLLAHMDERIRSRLSDLSLVRHVTIEAVDYRDRHLGRTARPGGASRSSGPARGRGYSR